MCATLKAAGEKFSGELSAREQVAVELGRETGLQKGRAKKVPHVSRPKRVWLAVKLGRGTESRNANAEPATVNHESGEIIGFIWPLVNRNLVARR